MTKVKALHESLPAPDTWSQPRNTILSPTNPYITNIKSLGLILLHLHLDEVAGKSSPGPNTKTPVTQEMTNKGMQQGEKTLSKKNCQ